MGMPQKEDYENRYLWMHGQGGVLFLIQESIKLIHFMAGQANSFGTSWA
jgi:hypothetical protein